ncbi:MAG: RDD family protein [Planctomycetota bacterium]
MSERIRFETPENIEVSYDVAGLGTRFAAWVFDQFLVTIVVFISFFALLLTGIAGDFIAEQFKDSFDASPPGQPPQLTTYLIGFFYILFSLGSFVYFAICELVMRGQTFGKRKLGIRVIQADGFSLRPSSVLVRTVFRVADHLPVLWIIPFTTAQSRRIGDFVAGTIVVSDDAEELSPVRESVSKDRLAEAQFKFSNAALGNVTAKDIQTTERVLARVPDIGHAEAAKIMKSICDSLASRMNVEPPEDSASEQFLRDFLAAHYYVEHRRLG